MGSDNDPFETDMKTLTSVFQKILFVPKPDYGSRFMLWKQILTAKGGILSPEFDLSALAKVSGL